MSRQDAKLDLSPQIWMPSDSFNERYNMIALEETMSALQLVDVKKDPQSETLLCVAKSIVYEVVEADQVADRRKCFASMGGDLVSCVVPSIVVAKESYDEEARVRELQLGLGRTSIKAAIDAVNSRTFDMAINDLVESFRMLRTHTQDIKRLRATDMHHSDNLFLPLIYASEKNKTIDAAKAKIIIAMMDRAIYPIPNKRTGKVEPWRIAGGIALEHRLTTKKPSVAKRSSSPKLKTSKKPVSGDEPLRYKTDAVPPLGALRQKREWQAPVSKMNAFLAAIPSDGQPRTMQERLTFLHQRYCHESAEFPLSSKEKSSEILRSGLNAYLEEQSKITPEIAEPLMKFFAKVHDQTIQRRFLTAGNLFAAQVNAGGLGHKGAKKIELPGIQEDKILECFKIIRYVCSRHNRNKAKETEPGKKLGDILEKYIEATFSPS